MISWSTQYSNGAWVVSDYATAKEILLSDQFSVQRAGRWVNTSSKDGLGDEFRMFKGLLRQSVVFLDGNKHRQIRALLIQKIRHAVNADFQTKLDLIVQEVIDSLRNNSSDLIRSLAKIVPIRSISHLIGINPSNQKVYCWCDDIAQFLSAPIESYQLALRAQNAIGEMAQYFEASISSGNYIGNDQRILDGLLEDLPRDNCRSREILLAQLCTLLFSGYETTQHLIGNALFLLLSNECQLALLKKQPDLLDACMNEVVRLESPVRYTGRLVKSDISIGGVQLKSGELLVIDIGAANRDPLIYENPNSFHIARKSAPHLGFGFGAHYCIGAHLSFMECRTILKNLLQKEIELNAPPIWTNNPLYRGLDSLIATIR